MFGGQTYVVTGIKGNFWNIDGKQKKPVSSRMTIYEIEFKIIDLQFT